MISKNFLKSLKDNLKTLFYALVIAVLIRSLFFQPFYIPSSSMEPTLLIGDESLFQNTPMVTANTPSHLVRQFQNLDFYINNHKEVILLYLRLQLIIELII